MRILVVTQYFWPESMRINELINALQATGCEVTVLTGQPNYPEGKVFKGYKAISTKKEIHNGYTVIRVPLIPRGRSGGLRLAINYLSFLFAASVIGPWLLRGRKFDAVMGVAQSPALAVIPAIILKKVKEVPLATWVGDLWPDSLESTGYVSNKLILGFMKRVVSWIYRNNELILIQSRTFREPILALCPTATIEYLPNPGEAIFSEPSPAPVASFQTNGGFIVMYAGNIGSVQSLDMILEAAELLQKETDVRFVLVGGGSKTGWLKTEIERRQLSNIELPGRFEPEYMPDILSRADVLLVSLVRNEAMSLTLPSKTQSYMAAGRPILASLDGEGARIITEAGAGIATPAEDAHALVQAIRGLKQASPESRTQMGNAAKKYYLENFESAVVAKKLSDNLEIMIRKNGA